VIQQRPDMFRRESLERLSSPERLDQLMRVVSPRDWWGLTVFGGLTLLGIGWSVFGSIPVTVTTRGVLVYPDRVVELQAPSTGQIKTLNLAPGDMIQKGEVIGQIDQSTVAEELRQQERQLARLQAQDRQLADLTGQRSQLDRATLDQQRRALKQQIQNLDTLDPALRDRSLSAIASQQRSLEQQLRSAQELAPILADRLSQRRKLQTDGAISADAVLEADQEYRSQLNRVADLQAQLQDLERQQVEIEQIYQNSLRQRLDLEAQLQDLDRQQATRAQEDAANRNDRQNQIQETRQQIAQLQQLLTQDGEIISPHTGRVLEISIQPGERLEAGEPLATIESLSQPAQLVNLAYFAISDGKRIQPGMVAQITPDVVKRERFGGILATVESVSAFPTSDRALISTVGNPTVGESLKVPGGQIEVRTQLQTDSKTRSGYRWSSSQGPNLQLSAGTTATVQITVEKRAPITFVLPFLRSVTGLD